MNVSGAILFNQTTFAGTTKVVSNPFPLSQVALLAYQVTIAGADPAGSLQLYVSCDEDRSEDGRNVTNWAPLGSAIVPATEGTTITNVPDIAYTWLKAEFTPDSGTGSLSLVVSGKG